jgi:fluoroacetyl-CoA thioesterase
MSDTLKAGLEHVEEWTAEGQLLTNVGGTLGLNVLSTPGMIGMMEYTATRAVASHLPSGSATVGFEVCIKHVAGAPEGTPCRSIAVLTDAEGLRKLRFDVEVRALDVEDPAGRLLGVGTHERRVIHVGEHASRVGGSAASEGEAPAS